jgi:short-subunit dehydrogenase
MSSIKNKIVLVTGGASGIGKIMSRIMLEKQAACVVIWDIDGEKLNMAVEELNVKGGNVRGYRVDLSRPEEIISTASLVEKEIGSVDIVLNNAGVITGKLFHQHTHDEITSTMLVNANALMHVAKTFLQTMINNGSGHICNIASAAGMVANPRMSVYCASKWAVIGWSESLRLEMEELRTGVKITTLIPYYISTGMFAGVKSVIPIKSPENAAARIIRAIENNRIVYKMPWIINLLPLAKGLLPIRAFDFFIGKGLQVYKSMRSFHGRTRS